MAGTHLGELKWYERGKEAFIILEPCALADELTNLPEGKFMSGRIGTKVIIQAPLDLEPYEAECSKWLRKKLKKYLVE